MFIRETKRLILRPFQDSDLEPFAAYRSDPEVARHQSWGTPFTHEQAAAFIETMKRTQPGVPGAWYQLAIERRGEEAGSNAGTGSPNAGVGNDLIGDCVFHIQAHDPRQAEIGFTLARGHQGQGYATEAVTTLLDFLFRELSLHRITATCDAQNNASVRLLERMGMRREGHLLKNTKAHDGWRDSYVYALLADERRVADS